MINQKIFMKFIAVSTLFLCLAGLVGFKTAHKNLVNSTNAQSIFEDDEEEFVELMDGKIIKGNVTKCNVYRTNNFKKEGSGGATIDGVKYKFDELMAIRFKKNYYYRKTENGDFASRVLKGRINRYITQTDAGSQTYKNYYVQKGDKGKVIAMSVENLRAMVNDYAPAIAVIDIYEKQTEKEIRKRKSPVTFECVEVYNNQ